MIMNEIDLAWRAGVFDGEGCIVLNSVGTLRVSISNTSPAVIRSFKEYPDWNLNRCSVSCLVLAWCNERCRSLLEALLPYLRVKKEQARLALAFLDKKKALRHKRLPVTRGKFRKSEEELELDLEYLAKMKSLNSERPFKAIYWEWQSEPITKKELREQDRKELLLTI